MKSLKGHLLVATPSLLDPNFARTVLLMFGHGDDGAAGIVLNRPTEATITEIAEQVFGEAFEWDKPVALGGPVPGPLMVIHTVEELGDQEVIDGIYSTVDAAKVRALIERRAEPTLIVANYAGWGPGQLEGEIEEDSWLSTPASVEHVFWDGAKDLWDAVIGTIHASALTQVLGIREVPDDPSVN